MRSPALHLSHLAAANRFPLLLLLLLLLLPAPCAHAQISDSARRVQVQFNAVPYPNGSTPTPASPLSVPCPLSIDYKFIERYRNIRPDDRNGQYDGILWNNLEVDGSSCLSSNTLRTATYFIIPGDDTAHQQQDQQHSDDSSVVIQPWFLVGRDNSGLSCNLFQATYPAFHQFTDDLPKFHDYLVQQRLLRPGHVPNPFRGDIYLFLVFERNDSLIRDPNICLFRAGPYVPGQDGGTTTGDDENDPRMTDVPDEGDGPACLSARMRVEVRRPPPPPRRRRSIWPGGAAMATTADRKASSTADPQEQQEQEWTVMDIGETRVGDILRSPTGKEDPIISFSHFDHDFVARFIVFDIAPVRLSQVQSDPVSSCGYNPEHECDTVVLTEVTNNGTASSVLSLELSAGHLVHLVDGSVKAARHVQFGDRLMAVQQQQHMAYDAMEVIAVRSVVRRGVYAPLTLSATLSVHGAVVSCYTDALLGAVEGHALSAPVRASWHVVGATVEWSRAIDWLRKRIWG